MEVLEDELIKRLLNRGKDSGRSDDQNEAIIQNRIREYQSKTEPIKNHYSLQGKFQAIEGMGSIDDIFDRLCEKIDLIIY